MKIALFLVTLMALGPALAADKCVALYRKVENNQTIEKTVEMKATYDDKFWLRLEADILEMGYVALFEKGTNRAQVTVSRGPAYTEGAITNTTYNDEGRFTQALVLNNIVGKITCTK
ncbi:MAG: hypothetical protein KF767_17920 [Bdellovibrionaceae bacterium]|nr:hypothetical protein [Pseudobdellovibrionaceae bacterium]